MLTLLPMMHKSFQYKGLDVRSHLKLQDRFVGITIAKMNLDLRATEQSRRRKSFESTSRGIELGGIADTYRFGRTKGKKFTSAVLSPSRRGPPAEITSFL